MPYACQYLSIGTALHYSLPGSSSTRSFLTQQKKLQLSSAAARRQHSEEYLEKSLAIRRDTKPYTPH